MLFDQVRQPVHEPLAVHRRHPRPLARIEGVAGRAHGPIDVGRVAERAMPMIRSLEGSRTSKVLPLAAATTRR